MSDPLSRARRERDEPPLPISERERRLAAALRENLRRRKEQARAQDRAEPEGEEEPRPPA